MSHDVVSCPHVPHWQIEDETNLPDVTDPAPDGHATCTRCQQHYRRTATVFIGTMEECVHVPGSPVKFQDMGYVDQAMILCPTCLELLQVFFAGGSVSLDVNPNVEAQTNHMSDLMSRGKRPGLVFKHPFLNPMPPKSERPDPDAPSPGVWADKSERPNDDYDHALWPKGNSIRYG